MVNGNGSKLVPRIIAVAIATATMVSVAYSQFQTKEEAAKYEHHIEKHLDRIEKKLDFLISPLSR